MRNSFWRTAALVGCLSILVSSTSYAQRQREYQIVSDAATQAGKSVLSYDSFEPAFDDVFEEELESDSDLVEQTQFLSGGIGGSRGLLNLGSNKTGGYFYVGAEYLQVRASFSEATAFVTQTQAAAPPSLNSVFNQLDFDYGPSYRVFGGYRVPDCCCEIQFGYTRFDSDATALGIVTPGDVIVAVPEEVFTNTPGTNVLVSGDVNAQSYDVAFAKTISLGGCCSSCDCGDSCSDSCCDCGSSCGSACCPAWDLTWSAGARYADVDWSRNSQTILTGTAPLVGNTALTAMEFQGAGPRFGLEGRRYFGKKYRASVFLKSDVSLLLGNVNIANTRNVAGLINTTILDTTQIIPVLDIVAGGTVSVSDRISVSGGYLFSAWHDLGMRDTFDILDDPGFQQPTDLTFDDANILGFDGYFVRAEVSF